MSNSLGKSWGPSTWYILHIISLTWQKQNIKMYIELINLIKKTIPCYICYQNFKKKLNMPNMSIQQNCKSREDMIKWIIKLHNLVNISNGKRRYSVEEVEKKYIKDNKLIVNKNHYIKFIKEYIIYNVRNGNSNNSIKLLAIIGILFPIFDKKKKFCNLINKFKRKRMTKFKFINNYAKIL